MVTFRNTTTKDGRRITITTNKAGKSGYKIIDRTPRKKATWKQFKYAVARDTGILQKKATQGWDAMASAANKILNPKEARVLTTKESFLANYYDRAKKNAVSDPLTINYNTGDSRNRGVLKMPTKNTDYKIASASANKKRTSGGRVLTKPAPVRMSNVVELENFVQKNMAAATSKNRGTSLMKEYQRSPEFVPIKVDTSTAKKDFSNPNKAYGELNTKKVVEWWKKRDKKIPTNTYTYDRNIMQKNNKAKLPKWMKTIKYNWNNNLNIFGNPK